MSAGQPFPAGLSNSSQIVEGGLSQRRMELPLACKSMYQVFHIMPLGITCLEEGISFLFC